jgi:pyruvate kinase
MTPPSADIRRTKIVCTIGPASDSEEMLARLIAAGMNVARVNFSHGTQEYHRAVIRRIKQVRRALNKPVAILQDLQGPKIRVGSIGGGTGFVTLLPGQEFVLTTKDVAGNDQQVSVSLKTLPEEVESGQRILLADGNIELNVERVTGHEVHCRVVVGGPLSSRKGINVECAGRFVDRERPSGYSSWT